MINLESEIASEIALSNYLDTKDNKLSFAIIDLTDIKNAYNLSLSRSGYTESFMDMYFKLFMETLLVQRADDPDSYENLDLDNISYLNTMEIDTKDDFDLKFAEHIFVNYYDMLLDIANALDVKIRVVKGEESYKIVPFKWCITKNTTKLKMLYNSNLDLDVIYT